MSFPVSKGKVCIPRSFPGEAPEQKNQQDRHHPVAQAGRINNRGEYRKMGLGNKEQEGEAFRYDRYLDQKNAFPYVPQD